jgi:hypothetical protein
MISYTLRYINVTEVDVMGGVVQPRCVLFELSLRKDLFNIFYQK